MNAKSQHPPPPPKFEIPRVKIPFVVYRAVAGSDIPQYHREWNNADMPGMKMFAMATFVNEKGTRNTVTGRVRLLDVPDFCGGLYVHSPQVTVWSPAQSGWYGSGGHPMTCHNATVNHELSWKEINTPDQTLAFDLSAVEGAPDVLSIQTAKEWMWQSLAQAVVSYSLRSGKRFIQGAGQSGDYMNRLVEDMQNTEEWNLAVRYWACVGFNTDNVDYHRRQEYLRNPHTIPDRFCYVSVPEFMRTRTTVQTAQNSSYEKVSLVSVDASSIGPHINWNSGNRCNLYTLVLTTGRHNDQSIEESEDDGWVCPECEEYNSYWNDECCNCGDEKENGSSFPTTIVDLPDQWHATLGNPQYYKHFPYECWGNG